jgi:hypothetical protein
LLKNSNLAESEISVEVNFVEEIEPECRQPHRRGPRLRAMFSVVVPQPDVMTEAQSASDFCPTPKRRVFQQNMSAGSTDRRNTSYLAR